MLSRLRTWSAQFRRGFQMLDAIADASVLAEVDRRRAATENPLNRAGYKVFSQADEDGIIAEILRRMGIPLGVYVEFGVGDGLECNTLALAAQGWRGAWISGESLAFDAAAVDASFFSFRRTWVLPGNVVRLYRDALGRLGANDADVLSFDLDSRDLFFLAKLLESGARPALVVAEYNAKFAPPIRWTVPAAEERAWAYTDYMGASLTSLADLFSRHGYRLVACNAASGANAFFIDERRFADRFDDVPRAIEALFVPPFYLMPRYAHPTDPRTALRCFEIGAATAQGRTRPEWPSDAQAEAPSNLLQEAC